MKKLIVLSALMLTATITLTSCEKKTTDGEPAADATEVPADAAPQTEATADTSATSTTTATVAPAGDAPAVEASATVKTETEKK